VIQPDPQAQASLARLATTKRNTLDFYRELLEIRNQSRSMKDGKKYYIGQAAFYDMSQHSRTTLAHVALHLQANEYYVVHCLLPYHDSTDEKLRSFVMKRLGGAATPSDEVRSEDPIVEALTSYIREHSQAPPWELVRVLYNRAPSAALLSFAQSCLTDQHEKVRAIYWAEHTIADVAWRQAIAMLQPGDVQRGEAELDKLSRYDEWWVRLYVAHMLRRHDDVFDAQPIRKRLRADLNPLVSEAVDMPFGHGMTIRERERWGRPSPATREVRDR